MNGGLALYMYLTVGLGAGAAFFGYDSTRYEDNVSVWVYLILGTLAWPIAIPAALYENYYQNRSTE